MVSDLGERDWCGWIRATADRIEIFERCQDSRKTKIAQRLFRRE